MAGIEHVTALAALMLLLILGRALVVFIWPYKKCGWCTSRTTRPRPWNRRRCWFCRNKRLRRRLGAGLVHKVRLALIQAWDERETD